MKKKQLDRIEKKLDALMIESGMGDVVVAINDTVNPDPKPPKG